MINTKALNFNIKAKADAEVGSFSAYGNTFGNVDHAGDKTMKGAFTKSIQGWAAKSKMPRLLSQHGHHQNPIGIITSMKEDEHGLLFEGKFCTEPGTAGAEAYALVKMGALDSFSIGYNTIKDKVVGNVKELHELDVVEISLVTFACNENSLIQSVKSALENGENPMRLVQKALQDSGLSKRQAQAAVTAIKDTQKIENAENDKVKSFKTKASVIETKFIDIDHDGEMSLYDFTRTITEAIKAVLIKSDDMYIYIDELYMDKAICCVCEYEDDDYKEYFVKINFTITDHGLPTMDVQVGSPVEVVRVVKWLTEEEVAKSQKPSEKSKDDVDDIDVTEVDIENIKNWFSPESKTETDEEIDISSIEGWFK